MQHDANIMLRVGDSARHEIGMKWAYDVNRRRDNGSVDNELT